MDRQTRPLRFVRAEDGVFLGVCKGLAAAFGIEVWILRLVWLIAVLWFGTGIFMYILLGLSLPRADKLNQAYHRKVLGVCARLSKSFDLEVGVVRAAALFLAVSSFGLVVLIYLGAHLMMPEDQNMREVK